MFEYVEVKVWVPSGFGVGRGCAVVRIHSLRLRPVAMTAQAVKYTPKDGFYSEWSVGPLVDLLDATGTEHEVIR